MATTTLNKNRTLFVIENFSGLLLKASLLLLALLSPIHGVMITVGILILADTVTGIWAAYRRKEKITSADLRRTVSKMLIYQTTIITGFLLQNYIMGETLPVVKVVAGIIGAVEFKSILENGQSILQMDIFKELIKRLGSKNDKSR